MSNNPRALVAEAQEVGVANSAPAGPHGRACDLVARLGQALAGALERAEKAEHLVRERVWLLDAAVEELHPPSSEGNSLAMRRLVTALEDAERAADEAGK